MRYDNCIYTPQLLNPLHVVGETYFESSYDVSLLTLLDMFDCQGLANTQSH